MAAATASPRSSTSSPLPNHSSSISFSSSGFASPSSTFSSWHSTFFHWAASPSRVNVSGHSVPFSLDLPVSPNMSMSRVATSKPSQQVVKRQSSTKRTCMCSPTTHPGSFRCRLHKNISGNGGQTDSYSSNRLNARRLAMTNSLVRMGAVKGGDVVKRALTALIRPSSNQQHCRASFVPKPSRLSIMSMAKDL